MKQCENCKKTKDISLFYRHKHYIDMLNNWCMRCQNEWVKNNSSKINKAKAISSQLQKEIALMTRQEKKESDFNKLAVSWITRKII